MATQYRKHFIPLESNPEVFTQLIHDLGVSPKLSFQDVLTLDEPAMFPRPALALVLIFPAAETYESQRVKEDAQYEEYASAENEEVVWFKQTINNACGLYAILHAVCNGKAKQFIEPGSLLSTILDTCLPLNPNDRALALENSEELEAVYSAVAVKGHTLAPNAQDDVDYHYVCFATSSSHHIYELDGDRKCPIDRGIIPPEDDMLSEDGLGILKEFIEEKGGNGFSLMALVSSHEPREQLGAGK